MKKENIPERLRRVAPQASACALAAGRWRRADPCAQDSMLAKKRKIYLGLETQMRLEPLLSLSLLLLLLMLPLLLSPPSPSLSLCAVVIVEAVEPVVVDVAFLVVC
jgi:hypothetical protein